MTRRIAWFGDMEALYQRLEILPRLQENLGLTTLFPESSVTHTSGFRVSAEVEALNPLSGWREQPGLADHRQAFGFAEHVFACVPGILAGAEDTRLRAVLAAAHALGMEVWGHLGLWCYGGEVFPAMALRDVNGQPVPATHYAWGWAFCPSRAELQAWLRAALAEATREYEIDGWFVDHARWPAPANWPSLWGCACEHCADEAAALGYDFARITAAARQAKARLENLEPAQVRAVASLDVSPFDLRPILDLDGALLDWFRFRADLLAARMKDLREAIHAVRPIPFGADVFPPTVALLGGHHYPTWTAGVDYVTGGVGPLLAWGTAVTRTVAEWTQVFRHHHPELPEAETIRFLLRLFGYEGFDLPPTVASLTALTPTTTATLTAHEFRKLRPALAGKVPAYPPLPLSYDLPALRDLLETLAECGYEGVVVSGLDFDDTARMRLVRDVLKG